MVEVCMGTVCGSAERKRGCRATSDASGMPRYPFVKQSDGMSPADLVREIQELEAVGSEPRAEDADYAAGIRAAQQRLADVYRSNCTPQRSAAG